MSEAMSPVEVDNVTLSDPAILAVVNVSNIPENPSRPERFESQKPDDLPLPINSFTFPKKDQSLFTNRCAPYNFGAYNDKDVHRVCVSPDRSKLVVGCRNGDIIFYHIRKEDENMLFCSMQKLGMSFMIVLTPEKFQ